MIKLAKVQVKLNIFSGFKYDKAILGGGDIAFPLMLSAVILRDFGILSALFSISGATLGFIFLLLHSKEKKFYPAMPFLTLGSFIMLLINFYLF